MSGSSAIFTDCGWLPMPRQRYYVDGKRVPGVTTITGNLGWSKEPLIRWANRMGLAGTELEDARKGPAQTGTIAHAAIEAEIGGTVADLSGLELAQRVAVEVILDRWVAWKEQHVAHVLLSERPLTSATLKYGGRLDMVFQGEDGKTWLCDVKTGGIYPEGLVQVAGYAMLVEESELFGDVPLKIDTLALLRIPQDSDSITTMERPWDPDSIEAKTFRLCRELHDIHWQLKREV